jgi:catechol 2,3-dioxygenase-like lactoylglutathione lyase family enzyme
MSRKFGAIRQVAYVVPDIKKAMQHWIEVLGVGPFFYLEKRTAQNSMYRDKPVSLELSIAIAQSGPLQIELIQQHNDSPSQFSDFMRSSMDGQHHVAFWTRDFDADMSRYLAEGFETLSSANRAPDRNAFLATRGPRGTLIEISEISGPKGAFFERVAKIASDWDGSDPIRKISRMAPEAL